MNFENSELQNCKFLLPSVISGCNFDHSNLHGAIFERAIFKDRNSFNSAKFDNTTKFDGAEMLRPASRQAVFTNYKFSRGQLQRIEHITNTLPKVDHNPTSSNETFRPNTKLARSIGRNLAKTSTQSVLECEELIELLNVQLSWWEGKKPNQNDEEWAKHHEFMKMILAGLQKLSKQITALENQQTDSDILAVGEQTINVQTNIQKWWNSFLSTISDSGKGVAQITLISGLTSGLAALSGADPNLALAISTAAIGGPDLVKAAKITGRKE